MDICAGCCMFFVLVFLYSVFVGFFRWFYFCYYCEVCMAFKINFDNVSDSDDSGSVSSSPYSINLHGDDLWDNDVVIDSWGDDDVDDENVVDSDEYCSIGDSDNIVSDGGNNVDSVIAVDGSDVLLSDLVAVSDDSDVEHNDFMNVEKGDFESGESFSGFDNPFLSDSDDVSGNVGNNSDSFKDVSGVGFDNPFLDDGVSDDGVVGSNGGVSDSVVDVGKDVVEEIVVGDDSTVGIDVDSVVELGGVSDDGVGLNFSDVVAISDDSDVGNGSVDESKVGSDSVGVVPVGAFGGGVGSRRVLGSGGGSDSSGSLVSEVVVGSGGKGDVSEVGSGVGSRYRYVSGSGRLNGAELRFFNNLQSSRKGALGDGSSLVSVLRGSVDGVDSRAERKARAVAYSQALHGSDALRRGSKVRFSEKDRDVLCFIAMFRFVKHEHLANIFCQSPVTMLKRLRKLRLQGLVLDRKIYGTSAIWFLTSAGMLLSGFDLPRVSESSLSYSTFPHQFTLNHVASHLWGGGLDVLNLGGDFPVRNRCDVRGDAVFGESLVSESEIQSSFGKAKNFQKGSVYKSELMASVDSAFLQWERSGGVGFGDSPEMLYGNEFMWVLFPSKNLQKSYHVPDLVVKRGRDVDGSPNSIAVEVEINNKPSDSYENTLLAYREDRRLFKEVVWVCKNSGPAKKLLDISKEIGLFQEKRIRIIPIMTEHGAFKDRDLWLI